MKFAMRRLLVTGGAGFIGSNFIRYWLTHHSEDRVVNLDKLTYAGNLENLKDIERHPAYKFVQGDICDAGLLDELFESEEINFVAHFAAESHVDRSILGPETFIRTNVHGTFTLLEAVRRYWKSGVNEEYRFLHISSDEVYGSLGTDDLPATEASPYAPNSPYAASKAAADHLVRAYHRTYGLPAIITNCSNNYGPYQFPEKLIPLTIHQAIKGEPIPVYGDGGNTRDWLYVEDHCAALEAVMERGRIGERYNVGGGNQLRNIDVVHLICNLLDERLDRLASPRRSLVRLVEDRPGHDRRYAMDNSKISRELKWRPQEAFETGLVKTMDWYLRNLTWVRRVMTGEYQGYFAAQYGSRLGLK